jgi:hypothetical protein
VPSYTPDGERNQLHFAPLLFHRPISLTRPQSKHTKALLLQYLDQNVSSTAQFFDVTTFPLPVDDKSHALDAFLELTGITLTNEWSLGDKVANHLLSAIRNQDRRNTACEAELKAELHFSLIVRHAPLFLPWPCFIHAFC